MAYYHITHKNNVSNIIRNGLLANTDGEIFLFENKSIVTIGTAKNSQNKLVLGRIKRTIADNIALNQLFLEEYAMFEIDANGITSYLKNDNVAEFGAKFQWIVKQPKIDKRYVSLFGYYKTDRNGELIETIEELDERIQLQLNKIGIVL